MEFRALERSKMHRDLSKGTRGCLHIEQVGPGVALVPHVVEAISAGMITSFPYNQDPGVKTHRAAPPNRLS